MTRKKKNVLVILQPMQCNHGLTMLLLILLLWTTMVSSGEDRKPDILQNLTLEYEPRRSIRLWTPYMAKSPTATWTVWYRWGFKRKRCSKGSDVRCEDVSPEGQCSPCIIQLPAYDGCGQYSGQGNVFNMIFFTLSIHNESASDRFYFPDWIKPGPVDNIQVQQRGSSWLTLKLSPPTRFDQCHLTHANGDNSLVFNYTVELVSLKEQSLLQEEGKLFYETYGFVRNLEDDKLALSQTVRSAFPRHSEVWKSIKYYYADHRHRPSKQTCKVTQLPLAGYHYNISVQTRAHYPGGTVWIRAETDESAPEEGPGLHDSFAYCPSTSEHCAACIIYFKEIPRPRRGGTILNHTLTLTLLNRGDISAGSNCGSKSNMEASTGGQNNTFHIPSLPVGAVYTVSLQAFNSKGPSPFTTAVLHVRASAPPFAAEDIVVESSGASYEMSWRSGQESSDIKVRYTVHTCSALPLQLSGEGSRDTGPSLPPHPLNCVTNMVSKELPENHPNSHTFVALPRGRGLTPVFFLSATTPTNLTSGLLPVDCFYAKNRVPEKVKSLDVQAMDNDPDGVKVKFRLPCGHDLDYIYGRPDSYPIGVEKGDGCVNCSKRMTKQSSTPFLVWLVSVAVAAIVGLVIIISGTRKCTQHYQQQQQKFETLDEKAAMVPPPPVKKKLQNGDVRGFTNPATLSQNSGVLSLPAPHWMIDFLSDNPPADAADDLSDQEGAEDSEEVSESVEEGEHRVDEGSATDRTNSRYQSQSSDTESADNSQASRGTAGRQAVLRASRYAAAVADRYSSQFAGEQDVNVEMEEDEEEEDLQEEEAEEVWIY